MMYDFQSIWNCIHAHPLIDPYGHHKLQDPFVPSLFSKDAPCTKLYAAAFEARESLAKRLGTSIEDDDIMEMVNRYNDMAEVMAREVYDTVLRMVVHDQNERETRTRKRLKELVRLEMSTLPKQPQEQG